jgi:hypothetical protein
MEMRIAGCVERVLHRLQVGRQADGESEGERHHGGAVGDVALVNELPDRDAGPLGPVASEPSLGAPRWRAPSTRNIVKWRSARPGGAW